MGGPIRRSKNFTGDINYLSGQIVSNNEHSNLSGLNWSEAGHIIDEDVSFDNYDLTDVGRIKMDVNGTDENGEGTLAWNHMDRTVSIHTGLGPVLQVGQERFVIGYNATQEIIPNGSVVYPVGILSGEHGGYASFDLAKSDTFEHFSLGVGVTTMDIPLSADGIGMIAIEGKVRDVNTTSYPPFSTLWISPSGGMPTHIRPEFPNYAVQIGGSGFPRVSGTIGLGIKDDATNTFINAWNGCFRESIDFRVDSDGTNVSGFLTPSNGNVDMTMCFSDGFSLLDTDPFAYIALIPGTDTNPQRNYIYVTIDNKYLEVSTSDWPNSSIEHIKVADIILRSASATQSDDAFKNQNWNDHIRGVNGNGHINHIAEALRRKVGASWLTGTAGSVTVSGTPSDVLVSVAGGKVMQLHEQTFPVISNNTGDDTHIINHFTTPYDGVSNLNGQTSDALGNSLSNKSFSFVLWGIANKTGENSHMLINLPTGSYAKNDPDSAVSDAFNYSVYNIPAEYKSVGFLIARFTFVLQADGITWSIYDTEDLRGKIPNSTAGGGAGGTGVTDFTGLNDTPSTYAGNAGNLLKVNSAESALEFTANNSTEWDSAYSTVNANSGDWEDHASLSNLEWSNAGHTIDGPIVMNGNNITGGQTIACGTVQAGQVNATAAGLITLGVGTINVTTVNGGTIVASNKIEARTIELEPVGSTGEAIKVIGTSQAGYLSGTIVDNSDVSSSSIAGWVKIAVEDKGDLITDQDYYIPVYTIS